MRDTSASAVGTSRYSRPPNMTAAPVAPAMPLLEAVGHGKLRVRFAAPPAEPACSFMTVYLRMAGSVGGWGTVNYETRRLIACGAQGKCVPVRGTYFPQHDVVVEGLSAGLWEATVNAMNVVGWGANSPLSYAVAVLEPKVPPAPAAPLLEAVGEGKLRVRFAAPPAEPACSFMTVYLRMVGAAEWLTVNCETRRLAERGSEGKCIRLPAASEVVVEGLFEGSWEATVNAMNVVGWGIASLTSDAVAVLGPRAPPAPAAPLLEAVGHGKLRVRFAAPPAEPACSEMAVYLRIVDSSHAAWGPVNHETRRLMTERWAEGKCVPVHAGEVVVEGLSAGLWEAKLSATNIVGFGAESPASSRVSVAAGDDDDDVAIVGSQSWADRDRELRKRAIDIDDGDVRQETEHGRKRHRSKMPSTLREALRRGWGEGRARG